MDVPEDVKHRPGMRDEVRHTKSGDVHTVETTCMKCFENGTTTVLLMNVPMFKELLVTSFECPHCGERNREVKSAAGLAEHAIRYELHFDAVMTSDEDIRKDLCRNIVRSETARILIPEVDFEIPAKRAELNTLEGFLLNIKESLQAGQDARREESEELWAKMDEFITRVEQFQEGRDSFTFVVDDLAGNSFIQNPYAPGPDPRCRVIKRHRTRQEVIDMGFSPDDEELARQDAERARERAAAGLDAGDKQALTIKPEDEESFRAELIAAAMAQIKEDQRVVSAQKQKQDAVRREQASKAAATAAAIAASSAHVAGAAGAEGAGAAKPALAPERGDQYKAGGSKAPLKMMGERVMAKQPLGKFDELVSKSENKAADFHAQCHECGRQNYTKMCLIDIPYFQTVIVMCTTCEYCGYKDSEIKPGGGVADQALKITLRASCKEDLTRDVLKSDEASISIPELDLELGHGTLGGKFSTVEGLLLDIIAQLDSTVGFYAGDSAVSDQKDKMMDFIGKIKQLLEGETPFTFVLDDPVGSSFVEGRIDGVPDTDPYCDATLTMEHYDRTEAQMDMLGLSDMRVEGYYEAKAKASGEEDDEDAGDEDEEDEEGGAVDEEEAEKAE